MTDETSARIKRWVPSCLLAAAITGASSCSQVAGPDIVNFDKVAHFAVFGLLGTLVHRAGRANANDQSQPDQAHGRDARATRHGGQSGQSWHGRLAHVWENLDEKSRWSKWPAWLAVLIVSAFGVTDEWHQSFVPGRSCDVFDWLADTAGAALAVALYVKWAWYRRLLEIRVGPQRQVEKPAAAESNPETLNRI